MSSVPESIQEINEVLLIQTVGWDVCPVEILFIIFEKLDITSLRCCLLVNRRWREIGYNLCEIQGLWQELVKDSIVNHGVTHRSKSTLSWKDLYFNSMLWNNLQSATILNTQELERKIIRNVHVYKDIIIIINAAYVEYYNIENFECVRVIPLKCEDFQESDDMIVVVHCQSLENNTNYYNLTLFTKLQEHNNLKYVVNHFISKPSKNACKMSQSWLWLVHNNCCYIIDWKCVLWKAYTTNDNWNIKVLARYYGPCQMKAMTTIHILNEELFVSLNGGDLVQVQRDCLGFSKKIRDVTYVIKGPNLNKRLQYKTGLYKFNALINVPFRTEPSQDSLCHNIIHFQYNDPEMSCGLQHGDVVFLGFEDGRVQIHLLKEHCTSKGFNEKPTVELNIKDFDRNPIQDPAIKGLDVCEIKGMHKLFIVTSCKLYQLLIQYPES